MFKRLERIEALLAELLTAERECLQVVRVRQMQLAAQELENARPFKCQFPGCALEGFHAHVVVVDNKTGEI